MFQVPQRQAQMSLLRSPFRRDSDSLNKNFAISHRSFSAILSAPSGFLMSKPETAFELDLKAAKRTQNFTGKR